ncbi:hypothetical protein HQN60_11735 [Deefgea piscis]|uniref:Uncharacterized protein n=1 Tax=Deefgea piscis TaxID=2739061 RepID=A0A6M8ST53_9NEIS|nr:hypothetical protein [Deefgea piscis]QKJ67314.1 hypothetical protein HQN60_11735 [Deefgea piscis]
MPLPLILWGAAALLAGTGVVKGVGAMSDFDDAKNIGKSAESRYKEAESDLDSQRKKTNAAFEKLGQIKLSVFTTQIKHLVQAIKNSGKNAQSTLSQFDQSFSVESLKEMEALVLKSLEIEHGIASGAVTGVLAGLGAYSGVGTLAAASTGAAISGLSGVAATNATLAWLGGGSLATGGFGMAGGALALGGIVLGPALAIGGFMMASKAEEALTKAKKYEADVDIAIEQMKSTEIILVALSDNAKEMASALVETARRFESIKVNNNQNPVAFEQMCMLGKGLKAIADTPIMESDGTASKHIKAKIAGFLVI